MSEQTMTGPRRMRQWAAYIEQNTKHHLLPLAVKNPDTLRQMAAQWEADRAEREKYQIAASVLCGAHIGVPQAACPVCRAAALEQRDETETMNIGATLFAVTLRDDNGAGEFSPGPCADVLIEWRRLRASRDDSERLITELVRDVANARNRADCAEAANVQERAEWSKLYSLLAGDDGAWSFDDFAWAIKSQQAALEQARAVERQLRIASDDPRASYETSRAYERAANDLEAALGVAPVSAQTCQECGHLESEHRSVAGGLGFACRHAGCDCIKQAAAPGGAA